MTRVSSAVHLLTVVVLIHDSRLLLLNRADWRSFAPNRWTGIGGKVEPAELGDLAGSARRELFEETDLTPDEVSPLELRRTLTFHRPSEGLFCLLYFTGRTSSDRVPACNEGTLRWIRPGDLTGFDVIDNSAVVFELLVEDVRFDRVGVRCGIATYTSEDRLDQIIFDEDVRTQ